MATITIDVPDEVASVLGQDAGRQTRFALEATVIEAYRRCLFSQVQCVRLLGIERLEFIQMLSDRQVAHPLTKNLVDGYHAIGKRFLE